MRTSATVTVALLTAALGVGVTSCAKSPPADEASPAGERNVTSWDEVRLYRDAAPDRTGGADWPRCEYEKLRWVRAELQPPTAVRPWELLKRAVWLAGGDAAFMVTRIYETDRAGNERSVGYKGLAIRFTDPECTH